MKNIKEIGVGFLVTLLLGGQAYYLYNLHPIKKSELEMTQMELQTKKRQLATLENQYANIEATREELKVTTLEGAAVKEKLPTYLTASRNMVDMIRLMENTSFSDLQVSVGSEERQVIEEQEVLKMNYQMQFITSFSNVKVILENLKHSYQLLSIHSLSIDNGPQASEADYEKHYEGQLDEWVAVQIDFSVYARPGVVEGLYEPTANTLTQPAAAFKNREAEFVKKLEEVTKPKPPEEVDEQAEDKPTISKQTFSFDIYDLLTSGHTHRFSAPNSGEENYVGVATSGQLQLNLAVWKDRYEVTLQPEGKEAKSLSGSLKGELPNFEIISYVEPIDGMIPDTSITITNHADEKMVVKVKGQNLGNVHIYNENGEEVKKGQQKGKLKVY